MSEFYRLRRTKISDGMALAGFIIGFLIPTYAAGKRMVEGFENSQETQGLSQFIVAILGNAIIGGVIGLVLGLAVGWVWERIHRMRRSSLADGGGEDEVSSVVAADKPVATLSTARGTATDRTPTISVPDARIRFDDTGFTVTDFLDLMNRVTPGEFDVARTASALERTINIGAWDGEELVGAIRVLTDGYLFATIPELMVDPAYRRQGIGRALMNRALDQSSTGVILFGSPPESSGFFERLGCQRAPSGYVLRRKVAPTVRTR